MTARCPTCHREIPTPGMGRPRRVLDVAEAHRLRGEGMPYAQIAARLGVPYSTLRAAMAREGAGSTVQPPVGPTAATGAGSDPKGAS